MNRQPPHSKLVSLFLTHEECMADPLLKIIHNSFYKVPTFTFTQSLLTKLREEFNIDILAKDEDKLKEMKDNIYNYLAENLSTERAIQLTPNFALSLAFLVLDINTRKRFSPTKKNTQQTIEKKRKPKKNTINYSKPKSESTKQKMRDSWLKKKQLKLAQDIINLGINIIKDHE